MVVGFNHNFRYKGEVYHIQTEDSGVKSPNIVTLLYHGGTILASKKTSYADIAKVDNLDQVVEELMKEQHKNMLRSLKSGDYDSVIELYQSDKSRPSETAKQEPFGSTVVEMESAVDDEAPISPPEEVVASARTTDTASASKVPSPAAEKPSPPTVETSLDEVILSYLMGDG